MRLSPPAAIIAGPVTASLDTSGSHPEIRLKFRERDGGDAQTYDVVCESLAELDDIIRVACEAKATLGDAVAQWRPAATALPQRVPEFRPRFAVQPEPLAGGGDAVRSLDELPAVDSQAWTCRACGAPMIGRRPLDDVCGPCTVVAATTAPPTAAEGPDGRSALAALARPRLAGELAAGDPELLPGGPLGVRVPAGEMPDGSPIWRPAVDPYAHQPGEPLDVADVQAHAPAPPVTLPDGFVPAAKDGETVLFDECRSRDGNWVCNGRAHHGGSIHAALSGNLDVMHSWPSGLDDGREQNLAAFHAAHDEQDAAEQAGAS